MRNFIENIATKKEMIKTLILSLTILLFINNNHLYCYANDAEEGKTVEETFSVPESTGHAFLETFQDDPFSRWIESSDSTYDGQKWAHEARKETSEFYKSDLVSNNIDRHIFFFPISVFYFL